MQMKLIAMAVAGLVAAPAFAQSNVQIYGSIDAMFETFSNDGVGVGQTDATHKTSRLGFVGSEDLGGGLKAFFQLEERFQLDTATANSAHRFQDKSWVGLSGGFGAVSFGRVPTALDIIYGGGKQANVDTIADWNGRKAQAATRFDNGISYTSPKLGVATIYAATAVNDTASERGNGTDGGKRPWDVATNLTFGPAFVELGYQDSAALGFYRTLLVNGGYRFGSWNLYAAFVQSRGYNANDNIEYTQYSMGADFKVGSSGQVFVTLGQSKGDNNGTDIAPANGSTASAEKYTKLGLAYVHNLSKRTQLIGATSFAKQSDGFGPAGDRKDSRIGLQAGVRHAF